MLSPRVSQLLTHRLDVSREHAAPGVVAQAVHEGGDDAARGFRPDRVEEPAAQDVDERRQCVCSRVVPVAEVLGGGDEWVKSDCQVSLGCSAWKRM
jgi:hypothetical protein